MARPTFTPDDEQRSVLDAIAYLAEQRKQRVEKVRKEIADQMDPLLAKAVELGVPVSHVAQSAALERKTVYRHLGKPMK